jgi:uncharacterized protein (DUF1778 family)
LFLQNDRAHVIFLPTGGEIMRLSEAMEETIQIRVARDEKRRLMDAARRTGLTLSDFVRDATIRLARQEAA